MTTFWHAFTECGGLTPVVLMALFVTAILTFSSPIATIRRWIISIALAGIAIVLAKGVFIPCGAYIPQLDMRSPSGHVAGSVAIYGGLAALLWTSAPGRLRVVVAVATVMLCVGIAMSRVIVHAHTIPEVVLGGLIGLIVPVRMLRAPRPHPDLRRPITIAGLVAIPIVALVVLTPQVRLSSEPLIQFASRWLSNRSGICPVPINAPWRQPVAWLPVPTTPSG